MSSEKWLGEAIGIAGLLRIANNREAEIKIIVEFAVKVESQTLERAAELAAEFPLPMYHDLCVIPENIAAKIRNLAKEKP